MVWNKLANWLENCHTIHSPPPNLLTAPHTLFQIDMEWTISTQCFAAPIFLLSGSSSYVLFFAIHSWGHEYYSSLTALLWLEAEYLPNLPRYEIPENYRAMWKNKVASCTHGYKIWAAETFPSMRGAALIASLCLSRRIPDLASHVQQMAFNGSLPLKIWFFLLRLLP